MKKDIKLFDIKDCLNEIVSIMQFQASKNNITIKLNFNCKIIQ